MAVNRLKSLDLLRGIAISMVVVFHAAIFFQPKYNGFQFMGYGAHGVQLFFLISAVTMCFMWAARGNETSKISKFYFRRFMRIAPVFWFAAVFYFAIKYFEGLAAEVELSDFLLSVFFLQGFHPATNNVLVPGGWSIAVEMFFYVIFPFVFILTKTNIRCLLGFLATYFVFNIVFTEIYKIADLRGVGGVTEHEFKEYLYQSIWTQLPVFFMGIFAYRLLFLKDRDSLLLVTCCFLVFLAVTFYMKYFTGLEGRPFFWIVCLLLMLLLIGVVSLDIGNVALQYIGRVSYSMYLFHFAVLEAFHKSVPDSWRNGWGSFAVWATLVFLASILVASVSKKYLEDFFASWTTRMLKSAR